MKYEYKVIPALSQGRPCEPIEGGTDRFAETLAETMTDLGRDGWVFLGTEHLKGRRRRFFVFSTTEIRSVLVFRRELEGSYVAREPVAMLAAPDPVMPRRVKRPDLVARVTAGERRLHLTVPETQRVRPSPEPGSDEFVSEMINRLNQVAAE